MTKRLDRRTLVRGALAGLALTGSPATAWAAPMIVPRRVLGGRGHLAPSDELTKAVIGVGGMGRSHMGYEGARLVAVCDVDGEHLSSALDRAPRGTGGHRDFREVLARDDVDIVHVATPPHWHALIAMAAAQAGKDVWCEKPMTRTIGEGVALAAAVRQTGAIFRLNTWFRFRSNFYGLKGPVAPIHKLAQARVFGWPLRVTIGESTGFDWKLGEWSGRTDLVPQPVPAQLDYDFWLGPAPFKSYNAHRVHGSFRGYWDYDGGGLGDMGQHYLDPVQYILGKDDTSPVEIEADCPQQHPDAAGTWRSIRMRYADGCEIVLDGRPATGARVPFLRGPLGMLYPGMRSTVPDLEGILAGLPDEGPPPVTDFAEAVRQRTPFALNQDNGHRSCTLVNLAKIVVRLRRPLRFDPDQWRFVGDAEADRLLDPPMRGAWHL